jgi:hypothetical protein
MVMASGSGSGWWPVATAGVLDNGNPLDGDAPTGLSGGRDHPLSLRRDVANFHGVYVTPSDAGLGRAA